MNKILMVCLGNICRSPLAEGIMKSKLNNTFEIDSAGTGGWHEGEQPDKRSIKVAKQFGIDISQQKARQIKQADLDYFDVVYVMDKNNYVNVLAICKNDEQKSKVKMILEEAKMTEENVPDPYYGNETDFVNVFELLDKACNKIVKNLH